MTSQATGLETELRPRVSGEIVQPGDRGYDEARAVYNAVHDRQPAVIVRAVETADVVAAVAFARDHDLPLAVRGGGHGVAGFATCDGGVVIDLGRMRRIEVDADRRLARAEGGCTWGDFNDATHAFGLATTGGVISSTGIGGLTLGGGLGYLSRTFGFSCDNLLGAEVVTAAGDVLTCSESENEDCSGPCAAEAATSESLRPSNTGSIRSRRFWAARSSSRSTGTFCGVCRISWLRRPSSSACCSGFMAAEDQNQARSSYGTNYERLVEVKRRHDPDNLFRLNQNIDPR